MHVQVHTVAVLGMKLFTTKAVSRDRLEVRTLRCGRNNPGSNPGHGSSTPSFFFFFQQTAHCVKKDIKFSYYLSRLTYIHIIKIRLSLQF